MPRLLLLTLAACTITPEPSPAPLSPTARYMAACEQALGPFPTLSCDDGVRIPITTTTVEEGTVSIGSTSQLPDGTCDKPSLLSGCTPGSRAGTVVNDHGVPFTFVCRQYDEDGDYDQMGVIAQHPETGDTCFWSTPDDGRGFDGHTIPTPASIADSTFFDDRPFWYSLQDLSQNSCITCHDNDAFVHTPWIRQVDVVPSMPLLPYNVVMHEELIERGGSSWEHRPEVIAPGVEACTSCHRLTDGLSLDLALDASGIKDPRLRTSPWFSQRWPTSHWMHDFDAERIGAAYPDETDWNHTYGDAVDALRRCNTGWESCFDATVDAPPPAIEPLGQLEIAIGRQHNLGSRDPLTPWAAHQEVELHMAPRNNGRSLEFEVEVKDVELLKLEARLTSPDGTLVHGESSNFLVAAWPDGTPYALSVMLPVFVAELQDLCAFEGTEQRLTVIASRMFEDGSTYDATAVHLPITLTMELAFDPDADGVEGICDVCPEDADPLQQDADADGVGDACDNCPRIANSNQRDQDLDGRGDACSD